MICPTCTSYETHFVGVSIRSFVYFFFFVNFSHIFRHFEWQHLGGSFATETPGHCTRRSRAFGRGGGWRGRLGRGARFYLRTYASTARNDKTPRRILYYCCRLHNTRARTVSVGIFYYFFAPFAGIILWCTRANPVIPGRRDCFSRRRRAPGAAPNPGAGGGRKFGRRRRRRRRGLIVPALG